MSGDAQSAEIAALLNAEGWIAMESSSHLPEKNGIGCICGFCVWSPEHVAVMSYRDGIRAALAHHRYTSPEQRTPKADR